MEQLLERQDSKIGLQHLECTYILKGKQKAWQEDLAGIRIAIKNRN